MACWDDVCWKRNGRCFICLDVVYGWLCKGASDLLLASNGCWNACARAVAALWWGEEGILPVGMDFAVAGGGKAGCWNMLARRRSGLCLDPVKGKREFLRLWQNSAQRHILKVEQTWLLLEHSHRRSWGAQFLTTGHENASPA